MNVARPGYGYLPGDAKGGNRAQSMAALTWPFVSRLIIALAMACTVSAGLAADNAPTQAGRRSSAISVSEAKAMKIRLTINGKSMTATLDDNPAARDFLALLPITLKLEDYASTEKVAYLPRKLTTQDAPAGIDPDVGDIAYYAPWGNLAIFYRDFGYSTGLVRLGRFDAGVEALSAPGSLNATIEAVGQ